VGDAPADDTARTVDIVREGFDLALRVGVPADSKLVGRVIGRGQAIYIASPAFLTKTTPIARPQDLEQIDAILIAGGSHEWNFQRSRRAVLVRPRARLTTPSFLVAREAALAGIGIARLPSYFVAADLIAGRLEQILTPWTPPEVAIMAVYPSRDLLAPKTSAFLELLSEHVAKYPLLAA
jgi:DNA-binding transcriptional LysR family regulator